MLEKIEYGGCIFQIDRERPNWRFKGGSPKMAPKPDPAPTPESIDTAAVAAGESEARLRKKKMGRSGLILTSGGLGVDTKTTDSKKSLLG